MYPDPSSPRITLWFSDLHLPILLGVITVGLWGGMPGKALKGERAKVYGPLGVRE